jgi:hypothetical protein
MLLHALIQGYNPNQPGPAYPNAFPIPNGFRQDFQQDMYYQPGPAYPDVLPMPNDFGQGYGQDIYNPPAGDIGQNGGLLVNGLDEQDVDFQMDGAFEE